jgi:hypothetical protein
MVLILMISIGARPFTRRVRRALRAVFGGAGHGEPGLAQGEERLGCVECPFAGGGADGAPYRRWHRGAGTARSQSNFHLAARRHRRARSDADVDVDFRKTRIGKDIAFQKPIGVSGVDPARALSRLGPHLKPLVVTSAA